MMKKPQFRCFAATLAIATLASFYPVHHSSAQSWQKVVDKGFGRPSNDYAWSMATFQGKLYVGTLNYMRGAEIWRSESGEPGTWERVYKALLFSSTGIRCLYADGDQALYACAFHPNGAQILRTTDGERWVVVKRKGFENRSNRSIRTMVRFGEYLYAGGGYGGAMLYRSKDGIRWELVDTSSNIDSTKVLDPRKNVMVPNNIMIGELVVFQDNLYAFTWVKDANVWNMLWFLDWVFSKNNINKDKLHIPEAPGAFEVWRSSDGVNWEKVVGQDDPYGNGMGFSLHDPENKDNDVVTSATVFQGHLYLGTGNDYGKTSIWRTADGTQWEKVVDFYEEGEEFNYYVWRMWPYNDTLFVGTFNLGPADSSGATGAQVWVSDSGSPGSFSPLVHNGFDGESVTITEDLELPKNYGIRSFGILNGTLFIGTATVPSFPTRRAGRRFGRTIVARDVGCEVWKMVP